MPMQQQISDQTAIREKIIADGVRSLAAELRLIDAVDLVAYLHTLNFANIGDLISSAVELHFKPRTLWFGRAGDIKLEWYGRPVVSLDMELHHLDVSAYFRLILDAFTAGVEINYINFGTARADAAENTKRLALAMEDARIVPRAKSLQRKLLAPTSPFMGEVGASR
jgi:hypothetical protein